MGEIAFSETLKPGPRPLDVHLEDLEEGLDYERRCQSECLDPREEKIEALLRKGEQQSGILQRVKNLDYKKILESFRIRRGIVNAYYSPRHVRSIVSENACFFASG